MWLLQSRRMALQTLERFRLAHPDGRTAKIVDTVQRAIMGDKYRAVMVRPDGSRRAYVTTDMILGAPIELTARDTLVCAGAGWTHDDIRAIAEAKRRTGFRVLRHHSPDVSAVLQGRRRRDPSQLLPHRLPARRSRRLQLERGGERRARLLRSQRPRARQDAVSTLGADIRAAAPVPPPAGLEPDRYALLVSTIEPRKGHRMIYEAWLELLDAGIPQRARFKLVFAERIGWLIEDLVAELRGDPRLQGTLEILTDADDDAIAALHRHAAFCVYPSQYEGYGLPVIEAFFHGKAVLASTGGAVPEVVGDFSPCLDPDDSAAWLAMLRLWIETPEARATYVERIRSSFHRPTWDRAAEAFFALVAQAADAANGD
jgi:glycosyltransferase involved in cell wall biosynthesis